MPEPTPPKPKCPSCGVEIEGTPDSCAKCSFDLKEFPGFYSIFKASMKKFNAEQAEEEKARKAEEDAKKPKKVSTIDYIRGRKGK